MNLIYRIVIFFFRISRLINILPDKFYLKVLYRRVMGKKLNLMNPQTFSEKLNWLKLYDRRPVYTKMVDKFEVKKYVAKIIGEEFIIPTLGVWDKFEDIEFNKLPDQFVLKCTHDSGSVIICRDKSKFDFNKAKERIEKALKTNMFYSGREWPYKNVKPKILAEKFIFEETGCDLKDYKIFNINGKSIIIQVDFDRFVNHRRNFYTVSWDFINLELLYCNDPTKLIEKPIHLDEMLNFAEKLSNNIPFCRTDFYSIKDKIYFGEITFFPEGGFFNFNPVEWNSKLNDLLILPLKNRYI